MCEFLLITQLAHLSLCQSAKWAVFDPQLAAFSLSTGKAGVPVFGDWWKPQSLRSFPSAGKYTVQYVLVLREMEVGRRSGGDAAVVREYG